MTPLAAHFFVWACLAGPALGGSSHASIKSKYGQQLETSSTLRWERTSSSSWKATPPEWAVRVEEGGEGAVCRAEHHGSVVNGRTTRNGACAVGFVNKIYE